MPLKRSISLVSASMRRKSRSRSSLGKLESAIASASNCAFRPTVDKGFLIYLKMNGLEAAKTIFKLYSIPVMILSAYSDPEYVSAAAEIGVCGFLLKPASQDHLRGRIEVAWGRFQDYLDKSKEIGSLKQRLDDRKTIEQAKWFIVQRKGITEPEAMKMLQKQARNSRRPLVEVAKSILDNVEIFAEN